MRITRIIASILLISLLAVSLIACGSDNDKTTDTTVTNPDSTETNTSFETETTLNDDSDISEEEIITDKVTNKIVQYTLREELSICHLAVVGKISAISDPFTVIPSDGKNPRNFYEIEITVDQTLMGQADSDNKINVRVAGGQVGNLKTFSIDTPVVSVDEEVILILNKAVKGSGKYVTDEDYYTIVGVNQGIYKVDGETVREESMTKSEFISTITDYAADRVIDLENTSIAEHNRLRESYMEGLMTEDEYNVAIALIDSYASRAN